MNKGYLILGLIFLLSISSTYGLNITSPLNNSVINSSVDVSWTESGLPIENFKVYLNSTNIYNLSSVGTGTLCFAGGSANCGYAGGDMEYHSTFFLLTNATVFNFTWGICSYQTGVIGTTYMLINYTNGSIYTTVECAYAKPSSGDPACGSTCAPFNNPYMNETIYSITQYYRKNTYSTYNVEAFSTYISPNYATTGAFNFNPYNYFSQVGLYNLNVSAFNYSGVLIDSQSINVSMPFNSLFNLSVFDIYSVPVLSFSGNLTDVNTNYSFNFSTSTGFAQFDFLRLHNYSLRVDSTLFSSFNESFTSNSSGYQPKSITLLPNNALNITIRDELSNAIVYSITTATFSSQNPSYNFPYSINGTYLVSGLVANDYSILLSNPSYSIKNYYVTVPDRSFQSLTFYLNNGTATLFNFKSSSGQSLSNVLFNVYSYVNNSLVLTESGISDITGKVQISARANTYYFFTTYLEGYGNYSFALNPILYNSYDVILYTSGSTLVIPSAQVSYSPSIFIMGLNNSFRISFASPYNSLGNYSFNVSYYNGSISGSGNSSSGQSFSTSFVIPKSSGDSSVIVFYEYWLSNGVYNNVTAVYRVPVTYSNHTIVNFGHEDYGFKIGDKIWIVTFIALPLVGMAFLFSGSMTFALFIVMFLFGIFGASGFLPKAISAGVIVLCFLFLMGKGNQ